MKLDPAIIAAAAELQRLPFELPEFLRKAWVSEEARRAHQVRIERVASAWETAEWRSADAVRPCALVSVLSSEYASLMSRIEDAGLSAAPLRAMETGHGQGPQKLLVVDVAVGLRRNVKAFRSAWMRRDNDTLGALLGYPPCCRTVFRYAFSSRGLRDYVWLVARTTPGSVSAGTDISLAGYPETNILLRRIGIRAISHFPCSFTCEASRQLSRQMLALAASLGYTEEVRWLREMLDWPMRWSARNGIAEILTPVVKIATHTDAMAESYAINWLGRTVPEEAGRGLSFPYRDVAVISRVC